MLDNPFRVMPDTAEVDGVVYPINSDFRVMVSLETEVLSHGQTDVAGLLLAFYKGRVPDNIEGAVDAMIAFYKGAKSSFQGDKPAKNVREYDYRLDVDVLTASFMGAYGIDLSTAQMHWWTFRRLLLNLPHDSPFMQRVHYRTADVGKMDKSLQKHYRKMKNLYALQRNPAEGHMTVEERDAALKAKLQRRFEEAQKVEQQDKG